MSKARSETTAKHSDIYDLFTEHSNLTFRNVGSLLDIACRDFSVNRGQFHHIVTLDGEELKAELNDFTYSSEDKVSLLICCDGTLDETQTYITGSTHWAALHLRKIEGSDKKITIQPYYMDSLGGDIPPVVIKVFTNEPEQKSSARRKLSSVPSNLLTSIALACPEQLSGYSSGYHSVFNLIRAHKATKEELVAESLPRETLEIATTAGIAAARTKLTAHEFINHCKNPLGKIFSEKTSDEKQLAEKQPEAFTSKTEGKPPAANSKAARAVKKSQETESFELLTSSIYRAWVVQGKTFKDRFEEMWAIKDAIQEEKNRLPDDLDHNFKGSLALKKIDQSCRKIIFDLVAQRTFETSSHEEENKEAAAARLKIKEFSEALNSLRTFEKLETNQKDFLRIFPSFLEMEELLDGIDEKISTLKAKACTAPLNKINPISKFGSLKAAGATSAELENSTTLQKEVVLVPSASFATPLKAGKDAEGNAEGDLASRLLTGNQGSPPVNQKSEKNLPPFVSPVLLQENNLSGKLSPDIFADLSPSPISKISSGSLVAGSGVKTTVNLDGNGDLSQVPHLKDSSLVVKALGRKVGSLRSEVAVAQDQTANGGALSPVLAQESKLKELILGETAAAEGDGGSEFSPRALITAAEPLERPTLTFLQPKSITDQFKDIEAMDEIRKAKRAVEKAERAERKKSKAITPAVNPTSPVATPLYSTSKGLKNYKIMTTSLSTSKSSYNLAKNPSPLKSASW